MTTALKSCPGNLVDCPLLNDFRKELKKSISNHISITSKNDNGSCQSNQSLSTTKNKSEKKNFKTGKSNEDKKQTGREVKGTPNTSRGVIRSTRAQDLRSQSNRDLLKPKTTNEKTRTASPYVRALPQTKKKNSTLNSDIVPITRSNTTKFEDRKKTAKTERIPNSPYGKGKAKEEKCSSASEDLSLHRQRTQEIINPKIVKNNLRKVGPDTAAGDSEPLPLRKSNTFFICKGTKNGAGDDKSKKTGKTFCDAENDSLSEGNVTDDDLSPKLKPLTHNDSFCLIVKSSQNWSQKNRSDDEKWLHYGLAYEDREKKGDKGILKNSNSNLKSVDSLEKVDSEKIVRFSDELLRNKTVLKKLVRRKKRLQNFFTPGWYQRNKLFQKYLEILREKSVLLSNGNETPVNLNRLMVPEQTKERFETEMFGLYPRRGKLMKSHTKDAHSY